MTLSLFSPDFMQRLAGSLLHFLWQGAVIAMLISLALRLLARRSAEARYAVSVVGLALMAAAPMLTFTFYGNTGRVAEHALSLLSQAAFDAGRSAASTGTAYWTRWIVLAWMAGVLTCLTRLAVAWRFSRALVHAASAAIPAAIAEMFEMLTKELRVRKPTRLLMSARIPTPAVIGWVRPAVLLPVCAITNLDEDQLRAVFAHELAHIRRHDFLINTLQRCVESMLFYHPAVWWLSGRTRSERENCCDDLAIRTCGDALSYAEALIALERSRADAAPALAIGATGGPLTQRIHRILGRETMNLDSQSAATAFFFVLLFVVAGVWQSTTLRAESIQPPMLQGQVQPMAPPPPVPSRPAVSESTSNMLNSIAAIITAQPLSPAPPQSNPRGTVQGIVTRQGTDQPIADVEVRVTVMPTQPAAGVAFSPAAQPSNVGAVANAQEARTAIAAGAPYARDGNGTIYFMIGGEAYSLRDQQDAQLYLDLASRSSVAPEVLQLLRAAVGRNPQTGEPLPEPPSFTAVTDSNGRFTIREVPAGNARVIAQLPGYFGAAVSGNNPTAAIVSTTVVDRQPSEVKIALIPGGSISGRVYDANGKLAADASVQILRVAYANGVQTLQAVAQKIADDRGEYRHYRLPPGDYYLAAVPAPAAGARGGGDGAREIPVRTLYPTATDLATAVRINLGGGDDLQGMDIRIKGATRARIAGSVVNSLPPSPPVVAATNGCGVAAGTARLPVANLRITPTAVNGLLDTTADPVIQSDPDGKFVVPNVMPGTYDVFASLPTPRGWGGENPPAFASCGIAFGRTTVDVRGSDIENVVVVVHDGADVKGQIVVDGVPTAANLRITLQADDSNGRLTSIFGNVYRQIGQYQPAIESDGSFMFPLVPHGRYRFQITMGVAPAPQTAQGGRGNPGARLPQTGLKPLPQGAYVADIRQGGASVYDNGILLESASANPVEVVIGTSPGGVQGVVTDADGKPVASGVVVLVPPESRRQNPALYRPVRTDAQGRFTMTAVPPGPYKLFAWEAVQQGAYQNPEFMKPYEARGTSIIVTGGIPTMTALKLIRD